MQEKAQQSSLLSPLPHHLEMKIKRVVLTVSILDTLCIRCDTFIKKIHHSFSYLFL